MKLTRSRHGTAIIQAGPLPCCFVDDEIDLEAEGKKKKMLSSHLRAPRQGATPRTRECIQAAALLLRF